VSGRITATLPLPLAASGLSAVIAEKSRVNDEADTAGTLALELALALEPEDVLPPLLPQAAATRPAAATPAVIANFLPILFNEATLLM